MTIKTVTRVLVISVLLCVSSLNDAQSVSLPNADTHWITAWGTALSAPELFPGQPESRAFTNQTLRQIVHVSAGGSRVRVRFSTFGTGPLLIGAAHIARRSGDAAIEPLSDRKLTFGGEGSIRIPSGAVALSDPVDLDVPAVSDLAISIFLPGATTLASWHFEAVQTSYVSPEGDFTDAANMPVASTTRYRDAFGAEHDAWFWLAGVDVMAPRPAGTIVALGDSLTDGTKSTVDSNHRWPDYLARRVSDLPGANAIGVLNAGIAGNKLLNDIIGANGLARLERDVFAAPGVTHLITLLGNNDILFVFSPADAVTAEQIIQGHKQLIARAHARTRGIWRNPDGTRRSFLIFSTEG